MITSESFARGLAQLAGRGLNLFGSAAVSALPEDIRSSIPHKYHGWYLGAFAHGGRRLWECLPTLESEHPIDEYSVSLVTEFVNDIVNDPNFEFAYPNPKLVLPLQRLGRFLNLGRPSEIGIDINPEFGLWFAYRVFFLTSVQIPDIRGADFSSPCETCKEKPCQNLSHFEARLACPVGAEHKYSTVQLAYHAGRAERIAKYLKLQDK